VNFTPSSGRGPGHVLDITPLVDVVFLLLIFFLLTATFVRNPNIPIRLPQASSHQVTPQKRDILVGITTEGLVRYESKTVTMAQLRVEMRKIHTTAPETMVLIQADREARHGRVVEVMDLAKQIGFERIGIAIETAAPPEDERREEAP
jgi:biopolymer transport protein ExbD